MESGLATRSGRLFSIFFLIDDNLFAFFWRLDISSRSIRSLFVSEEASSSSPFSMIPLVVRRKYGLLGVAT